jgi:transcriptional regulator
VYLPQWYKEEREEVLLDAMDKISFGTLVTSAKSGPLASHIPMVPSTEGGKVKILGHIARGNLQWRDTVSGTEALAIFVGPHGYISPAWYETRRSTGEVVPTWNYIAVHARGQIVFFDDADRLDRLVTMLTEKFEGTSGGGWSASEPPREYYAKELKAIVGFEIAVKKIEGKWKLSQNRSSADVRGAIEGLKQRGEGDDIPLSQEMKTANAGRLASDDEP